MADEISWESWAPDYATHVRGRYHRRRWDESGLPMPQVIECECTMCKATWTTQCTTVQVRAHIARFANVHLHRDPLAPLPRRA